MKEVHKFTIVRELGGNRLTMEQKFFEDKEDAVASSVAHFTDLVEQLKNSKVKHTVMLEDALTGSCALIGPTDSGMQTWSYKVETYDVEPKKESGYHDLVDRSCTERPG